jgi:AAA domain
LAEPPKPVAPTARFAVPQGVPAGQGRVAGNTPVVLPISVDTARPRYSQLRDKRERIQIVGDSNAGKTFAWLTEMARRMALALEANERIPQAFVLDTDDTMPAMLEEGADFHGLYVEDGGNVHVFPCDTWGDIVGSLQTIKKVLLPGDFIVFDVVNQAYDLAVAEVAKSYGIDVASETFRRIQSKEGFGAFPAEIWNAVTVIFDGAIRQCTNSVAHVIFVQHLTDYVDQRSTREITLMFDQIGVKPQGAKKISRIANTVVFLWTIRAIQKDERGRRPKDRPTSIVRKMTIVKDRGKLTFADEVYDKLFFEKLEEVRSRAVTTVNITDPTSAGNIVAETMARIRAAQSGEQAPDAPGGMVEAEDAAV